MSKAIGHLSQQSHGFWYSIRFLVLRRLSQLGIIGLFLLGPLTGTWIMKGNLSSSEILGTVPLTDPYVFLQLLASGHIPEANAIIGVLIVLGFYMLVGGRVFCAWVCPINMVTDLAAWMRRKMGINSHTPISKNIRHILLAATLVTPLVIGFVAWELINPVSLFHRGIIFGIGYGGLVILAIFLFDLFVVRQGWCGYLCPMGSFYRVINSAGVLRVNTINREKCTDCGDCFQVCPEPQVLKKPLKKANREKNLITPLVNMPDCTNCGRCIDVCEPKVIEFSSRFYIHESSDKR